MPNRQPFTLDRVVRLIITISIILGAMWIINVLKGVLLPFLVAWLIAYIMEPFVQFNRKLLHLKSRTPAIFVTLFEALFFCSMATYFIAPMLIDELHQAAQIFRNYAATNSTVPFLPEQLNDIIRRNVDFNAISEMLTRQEWGVIIENIATALWSIVTSGISMVISLFSWIIVVLYVVFIMMDYDRIITGFRHMVPKKARPIVFKIGKDIEDSMNHYFRGQALIAFIVGILFSIGFLIVGIPMAVFLGLFIGLLNLVPYLQLISIIPTTLLCLVYSVGGGGDFWQIFWQCIAVYAIVQVIQDLFLTPKIMGKAMGLNPAIILLSLSIWGTLLGFIGLIIALPLTTLLLSYSDQYLINRADNNGDSHTQHNDDAEVFKESVETPIADEE